MSKREYNDQGAQRPGERSEQREYDDQGINVLSFFDGISAGQEALRQLGVRVDNYYAIEVDSKAIEATQARFPNTKQVGNILRFDKKERGFIDSLPVIDLVFAGSPCQGFSKSGKGLGLDDPRSKLFYNFHRIWKKINQKRLDLGLSPAPFFFENVVMHQDFAEQISRHLGSEYIDIDAIDYSPCARKRYYWTNMNIPESIFTKYTSTQVYSDILITTKPDKSRVIYKPKLSNAGTSAKNKIFFKKTKDSLSVGTLYHVNSQGYRFNKIHKKMPTFTASGRSINPGIGAFAFPNIYISGKRIFRFKMNEKTASSLGMKPGEYTVFRPDIKEAMMAMGFASNYYEGTTLTLREQIHGIGNSWHVTVVKMLIESYCSRQGWIR